MTASSPVTALNGVLSFWIQNSDLSRWFVHSDRVLAMEGYQESSLVGEGGMIGFGMIELSWYVDDLQIRQLLIAGAGELLAEDLRQCQHHLGEITGAVSSDDLLGEIFSSFCIGK